MGALKLDDIYGYLECENTLGVEEGRWWEVTKRKVLALVMTELKVSSA